MDGLPPPTQSGLRATASASLSTGASTPSPPATSGSRTARRFATRTTRGTSTTSTPTSTTPQRGPETAKNAGMSYVVVTTKHHDGFCLWDSELTDYKATNTPAGRDLLAPVRRGVPRRGPEGRLLPLPDRLAPPGVPGRRPAPAARRRGVQRGQQRPRHRPLPRVPARPDPRAADPLRPHRHHVVRLLLLGPGLGRQRQGGLGLRGADGDCRASCSRASSSTTGWRSVATSTPPSSTSRGRWLEVGRPAGPLGGLPDAQRVAGATTATTWTGSRSTCSSGCWWTPSPRAATCSSTSGRTARGEFDPRALDTLRDVGEWMRLHGRSICGLHARATSHRRPTAATPQTRQPALPAPLRLAVQARPSRRAGRQGGVRATPQRRLGDKDAGHRPCPAGPEHDRGRYP